MRYQGAMLPAVLAFAAAAGAATSKYRVLWRDNPSNSAVVGWVQSGGTAAVHYGTEDQGTDAAAYPLSRPADRTVTQSGMSHAFARLTGLAPNTAYYFVIKDAQGTSPRMWFRTAPADGKTPFTLIAGGDSRNNRTPRQNANRLVSKLRPLGVTFAGDMTDQGTDQEWSDWWDDWQLTRSADGRMYPILAARGNHESSDAFIHNMFDSPVAGVYFAVDLGGSLLRIYTLNTETSIAGNQTTWLSGDLAANGKRTWKLAQYHKPIRPHEAAKVEGTAQYTHWAPLFHKHAMTLVVECDAHTVKTTWPIRPSTEAGSDEGFIRDDATGTVFVGEGTWGAPLRAADDTKAWTRASGSFNQFHWIHVTADSLTFRNVRVDNAASVGSVSDAAPFAYPSGIDVWNPAGGSVVKFLPKVPVSLADGTPRMLPPVSPVLYDAKGGRLDAKRFRVWDGIARSNGPAAGIYYLRTVPGDGRLQPVLGGPQP